MSQRVKETILSFCVLAGLLCTLVWLASLGGCAPVNAKPDFTAANNAGQSVIDHIDSAGKAINAAKPHADTVGQTYIGTAWEELTTAITSETSEISSITKIQSDYQKVSALETTYQTEASWWWSPRQRGFFWTAVGIIAALAVGFVLLQAAPAFSTPIDAILKVVGHVLTLGLGLVGKGVANIVAWFARKLPGAKVATPTSPVTGTGTVAGGAA